MNNQRLMAIMLHDLDKTSIEKEEKREEKNRIIKERHLAQE